MKKSTLLKATCLSCSVEFSYREKTQRGKFCSNQCQRDHNYTEYIQRWKSGVEDGRRGRDQISNNIRRYLLEKAGGSCEMCGWNMVNIFTGKVPLQVSHKNGDWRDNREENLEIVCPNCHSLTEFHGARNKGRGRYALTGQPHPRHKHTEFVE